MLKNTIYVLLCQMLYSAPSFGAIEVASPYAKVLLQENFSQNTWWTTGWWGDLFEEGIPEPSIPTPWASTVDSPDCSGKNCNQVLKVTIPKGTYSLNRFFSKDLDVREAWAQYRIWIPADLGGWDLGEDQKDINKLPGFNGGGKGKGNKVETDGKNGWSARVGWRVDRSDNFNLFFYTYHMDRSRDHGDLMPWNVSVPRDTWITVTQHLKVNSLGEMGANFDGELEAWVDGRLVFSRTDLRFTSTTDYEVIKNFWLTVYFGGNRTAPEKIKFYFDELEVSGIKREATITLSQNYPNPVTKATNYMSKTRLIVKENGPVSIELINMLGQVARTLKTNQFYEKGEYEIDLNFSGLASGIYLLVASRGGKSQTKEGMERTDGIKVLVMN